MVATRAATKKRKREEDEQAHAAKKAKQEEQAKQLPPLLRLPAELRNHIYEEALVDPIKTIAVTKDLKPPGLLSTCRQIRSETQKLYFHENQFRHNIDSCDGSLHVAWHAAFWSYIDDPETGECPMFVLEMWGWADWRALLKWLEVCLKQGPNIITNGDHAQYRSFTRLKQVVYAAHNIVTNSRIQGRSWEDTKRDLEWFRRATEASGFRWV